MGVNSLKQKTLTGLGWSFTDNLLSQGVAFGVGIVLARLLSPEEFGVIGIVSIFIAVFTSIVDSGFSGALIRRNNAKEIDYNTVFIFNLVLSCILFFVLYFLAPGISLFFGNDQLIALTRAMGIILVVNAFGIIQRTILIKKINFKTLAKISVLSSVISGSIGMGMAWSGYGVWSLVIQQISRQSLNSLFLWVFNRWRPRLQFSIQSFRELFSYGSKMLASGLLDILKTQVFTAVIGKCYTAEVLGQYTRAKQFGTIFSDNLTGITQRVSYPVLSSIQDEPERLKSAYRKIMGTTMFVSLVCMLGVAAVARPMILILIGEKWLPSVDCLQIICFSGICYPLNAINLNILQVKGRSDIFLKLQIIHVFFYILPILLGFFVEIKGMLWSTVVIVYILTCFNCHYSGREIHYTMREQIKDVLPSLGIALFVSGIAYTISFAPFSPYVVLPAQLLTGATVFYLLCEYTGNKNYFEIKHILLRIQKPN
ncbi:MAG: lipopolysaccharide biosynthesis protein [Tannerellaceae bacterium]|jgi:O-antigen/teichoic acid export membrane protein|nr:lipopolysaccharide biosynthesis protein [Tannerellaceae bacterium]